MQSIVGNMGEPLERGDEEYQDEELATDVSHDLTAIGGEEGGEKLPVAQKRNQDEILEVRDCLAHPLKLRPCFRSRTVPEFKNPIFYAVATRVSYQFTSKSHSPECIHSLVLLILRRMLHPSISTNVES